MKATNAPTQTTVPFAASGTKNTIPVPSQQGTTPGAASMTDGFPPQTMQPIASGGIPPFGADMNGILNQLSAAVQWAQAGGQFPFNATFAAAIGGYPAGALVLNAAGTGQWLNTVDQNSTNPDASGAAGWVAVRANSGVASLTATSGNVTPTAAQLAAQVISVTGTLTANAAVVLPLAAGATWIVANNTTGSFTLAVNGATGSGVTIPQGSAIGVYTDGTNFYATSASVTGQYLPINGTAVAATKLATARAFNLTGPVTAAAQNFDGTGNVTLSTAIADAALTIAKTNGLQTALDGKLGLGGGTLSGGLTLSAGNLTVANGTFSVSGGITFGQGLSSSTAAAVLGTAGAGTIYLRPNGSGSTSGQAQVAASGILTAASDVQSSQNFVSTSVNAVLATTGAGACYLRPNGAASAAGQLYLDSGGNLTVSGTANFQGSDRRLKRDVVRSAPRPIHRGLSLFDYTLVASGEAGRGVLAHHLQVRAPEYVGQFEVQQGRRKVKRLSVNYAGTALEIAIWSANEVDRLTKLVASLQKQLKQRKG